MFETLTLGTNIDGRTIIEIGTEVRCDLHWGVVPVKFDDGAYSIILAREKVSRNVLWMPDCPEAARAITESLDMPMIAHTLGRDVVHVRGVDYEGKYLVKYFLNGMKEHGARKDELIR